MKVKLKTLSPVHVGSGIQLQNNCEYVYFDRENCIAISDEARILALIGPENIGIWLNAIENSRPDELLRYLRQRKSGSPLVAADIARRVLPLGGKAPGHNMALREQIRSEVLGVPYLPGSSLKGAIRTALFASGLREKYPEEVPEDMLLEPEKDNKRNYTPSPEQERKQLKKRLNHKELMKSFMGKTPNHDWLRLLRVGDCHFTPGITLAGYTETLNKDGKGYFMDSPRLVQLIEYIPAGQTAMLDVHLPEAQQKLIFDLRPDSMHAQGRSFNLRNLPARLHRHSLKLLKAEIDMFREPTLPEKAGDMVVFMEELYEEAKRYPENKCLLRLGFGTGYRNMTGDWVGELVKDDDLYDLIAETARKTHVYNNYFLPKTRKMMSNGHLMGYVQLTFDF